MKTCVDEADSWSSGMWLSELMYGAEKSLLKESGKLAVTKFDLSRGILGGLVEIKTTGVETEPVVGVLKKFDLCECTLTIKADGELTEIKYGEVSLETEDGIQTLHSSPLITMKTDRPYKL